VLDPLEVLHQPEPGGLEDVLGVADGHPMTTDDRPNQCGVLVDQAIPGVLGALGCVLDELTDGEVGHVNSRYSATTAGTGVVVDWRQRALSALTEYMTS